MPTQTETPTFHTTSTPTSPITPAFAPIPHGALTARGIDTTNTTFPISNLRTPVTLLPFPHPKWHVRPASGEVYEVTSPILEEYDPVTGWVDGVGSVRESVKNKGFWERDEKVWTGRVEWPESGMRSSIAREKERELEKEEGKVGDEVRRSKMLRGKR